MEQEARENAGTKETGNEMREIVLVDTESYVNVEVDVENNDGISEVAHNVSAITQGLCGTMFILTFSSIN